MISSSATIKCIHCLSCREFVCLLKALMALVLLFVQKHTNMRVAGGGRWVRRLRNGGGFILTGKNDDHSSSREGTEEEDE